ncbi:elongator complex protein 4 [Bicyclus anynana]|uniref:Elongator complex protein 4 n=1 Tax=Bicyclus anynana TaxID=110368 RepID=A0ABM3LGB4_BICAN|nr:elongator complex protein 4 [Bicyclus anynana]
MTSFHKTSSFHTTLRGTKLKNNLIYISSGIPSLDFIIGGGLPAGSVFLVEEDVLGSHSRVLTKYFLAEGVVCKHDLYVASADESPQDIVKELPQPCTAPNEEKSSHDSGGEMKIAWRYEGLGKVESSFGSNTNFGHHFDLSKHIDQDTLQNCNISYCHLLQSESNIDGFRNNLYHTLLTKIKTTLSKEEYKSCSKNKNILRISIQSLGSPVWMAMDCDTQTTYGQDLVKFLYCLRILVRDTNAVIFITMPSHLFDDDRLIDRILYTVDNAVAIESFTGSSKETNPVFSEYHGLFHITKLSALHSLVPFVPPSLDLAFKLRRKKFVIEKLHLPPELQESSEREQDDITAVPKSCGGFKKKDIDF